MGEFDFIAQHFRPLAGKGAFQLRNDGAVLSAPEGYDLAISSDTMVENLHFLPDDPAHTIAQKLLRCNLSDLAAMGALPAGYMLNVSVPSGSRYNDAWFGDFSQGLAHDQDYYQFSLLGGDTTGSPGPLVLSLTIFGFQKRGQVLRRDKSKPGDQVWVTGSLGRAALGLQARKGQLLDPTGELVQAYRVPTPRVGLPLYGIATAALDISDGLIQDAGHIAEESKVAITLYVNRIPFSEAVRQQGEKWHEVALIGGDDYELLLTCPPDKSDELLQRCRDHHVPITQIGEVTEGKGVTLLDAAHHPMRLSRTGWQHF
ncbi:thiamine-phosphate kinase [Saccharibacter sp. 17.LH.SD]|uniref:thiamine-phosphate kinase n=1 Tax=Saccharibacter sp. 17.LH.SD TaxID=2689393 RepID=UPI00136BDAC4|nr:thiamine-phosphate kinase [Saccharibacter sp. 17.LH.SD]MXV43578.1 thiamine-phosphate kinase [Saccharibacter sp. 17.LH.SD]